jgi:putative heme transporter
MTTAARWRARARRAWPVAKYVIGLALAAIAFDQLAGHDSELAEAPTALSQLRWGWALAAVVAEAGSFLALVQVQRRLLAAGRVDVPAGPMAAITVAANSIANSLPGGSVFAPIFSFRQFRRWGADQAVAGWSVLATLVVGSVTLTVVAASGALVAGADGASLDLVAPIVGVLILALAAGALFAHERALEWTVAAVVRLSRRLTGRPRDKVAARIDGIMVRLRVVHLSPGQVAGVLWWGLANWVLDCSCLALSFLAVGAGVPWKGLLLAYGAGQLAANLPITPGGLGVVEGSLTIAIVAFGGATTSTVLAVLLYRVISFWLTLPLGWGAWAWLAWFGRRRLPVSVPASSADAPASGTDGDAPSGGLPGSGGEESPRMTR